MLFPAVLRAQLPFGIWKISSRDADVMGANAAQASPPTTPAARNVATQYLNGSFTDLSSEGAHLVFQENPEIVNIVVRSVPVRHQRAQLSAPVDDIGVRRMRDDIARSRRLLVGSDAVLLAHGSQLVRSTGATDKCWIEGSEICPHPLGIVSFRIDGDVHDLDLIAVRS